VGRSDRRDRGRRTTLLPEVQWRKKARRTGLCDGKGGTIAAQSIGSAPDQAVCPILSYTRYTVGGSHSPKTLPLVAPTSLQRDARSLASGSGSGSGRGEERRLIHTAGLNKGLGRTLGRVRHRSELICAVLLNNNADKCTRHTAPIHCTPTIEKNTNTFIRINSSGGTEKFAKRLAAPECVVCCTIGKTQNLTKKLISPQDRGILHLEPYKKIH